MPDPYCEVRQAGSALSIGQSIPFLLLKKQIKRLCGFYYLHSLNFQHCII
jgi:hypothetical protein